MDDVTPNTRFSVQLFGFVIIVASVWGAGFKAADAYNDFRHEIEENNRTLRGEIRDLRGELALGQERIAAQFAGTWTLADQRRWVKAMQQYNPDLKIPDPEDIKQK